MSRQRDIKDVVVFGNPFTGVQDVALDPQGEKIPHSGDASTSIQNIQITKIKTGISISVEDPDHKRDVAGVFFGAIVFTAAIDNIITSNGHGLNDGDKVRFFTTDTLPAGLDPNTTYFVINSTTNTFKVSLTSGGSEITITDIGTGIQKFQRGLIEVLKVSAKEGCSEIDDSADANLFISFLGVTGKMLEVTIELRDVTQALGLISIGELGQLDIVVPLGSVTSGLIGSDTETFTLKNMTVVGQNTGAKHADIASNSLSLEGVGENGANIENTLSAGGSTPFEINCGDSGEISYKIPSADGGDDETVTVSNCVCTGVELSVEHAGRLQRKFDFGSFSSDGSTPPLVLS